MPQPYAGTRGTCSHTRKECKHGIMHSQCKCMDRHEIEIVPCDSECKVLQEKLEGT